MLRICGRCYHTDVIILMTPLQNYNVNLTLMSTFRIVRRQVMYAFTKKGKPITYFLRFVSLGGDQKIKVRHDCNIIIRASGKKVMQRLLS